MKTSKTKTVIRIIYGAFLAFFGLNGIFQFMPLPAPTPEGGEFLGALLKAGYIMPIVGILEVGVGVLLLINRYTSLALILIFPIILNAFLFHLALDLPGIGGSLLALILNVTLFVLYKDSYKQIFQLKSN
ncbi:DoxX protein [Tenacibaculum sp. Bg11-29]|uniref:DoxX protein n=1 Tax=Tenacibaculum sp. Bg11-29 TaxID=2058306 RepID=UPI000C31D74B|nr:DoxX protein [Tenacibaculum sp. Bg11-29]PKH51787.1 DoxX protein [Tenacibaculum sp. Bg11-29]